ncbi:MAG: AraC family transcriptional regulator [Clostridia bacterium]|nr:AraC family transcriptional regulator [Clostridia bacterium]
MRYDINTEGLSFHHVIDEVPDPSIFQMHTHPKYEIFWFMAGKGTFYIEGTAYPLHVGDILIMRSNEAHYIAISPEQPYERCAFHFDPALVRRTGCGAALLDVFEKRLPGQNNCFSAADFQNDDVYGAFLRICSGGEADKLQALSYLFPLLFALNTVKREAPPFEEGVVYQIASYVNRHLEEPLSLEKICKRFFLSKSKLCRLFKQEMGTTVWQYITVKRLTTARQLINEGKKPAEAAVAVGFSEYSVFWRAYKKYFSASPKET